MSTRRRPLPDQSRPARPVTDAARTRSGARRPTSDPVRTRPMHLPAVLPQFVLDRHVFFLLGQVMSRRMKDVERGLESMGLRGPQWRVLGTLHARPGISLTVLGELTTVDRTAAMRTVEALRAQGAVERIVDPDNRRSALLFLTESGERLFARAHAVVKELEQRALKGIDEGEIEVLIAQLHRMIANLRPASAPTGPVRAPSRKRNAGARTGV
jgi:DNA-binding MarR family transcriptional regulator